VIGYNPRSPGGRAIPIIPTRWLAYGWSSMSMLSPATSTHPNISRPACGRCSIASRVICAVSVAWRLRVRQRAYHARSEQRGLAYLFKLRLTANVKRMIERLSTQREWANTGQGWQAKESLLRLEGWAGSAA